jgi:hypothetical protein
VVTIRPSNAGTVVERTLAIWADHHIGVTFDGTDPAHATFSFFGTSSAISAGTIGWNGGYCAKNPYGMVIAPCADGVELTNFDARSGNVYRGNLVLQGRNGTAQLDFCIDPARPTRALVRNLTSNLFSRSVAYNQDGKLLLNGRANVGQYAALDTSSGAGWVNVQVRGSGHTSETSCGFGYSDAAYMEVAY